MRPPSLSALGLPAFAAAGAFAPAGSATALTPITQTPQGDETALVDGGADWTGFTALIDAAFSVSQVAGFEGLGTPDAILVSQECNNVLTATEIADIGFYLAAGGTAVMFTGNELWDPWTTSLMAIAGGAFVSGCFYDVGTPQVANALTTGVSAVEPTCGSKLDPGTGSPMSLFSNNFAGLYRVGGGQALVIFDVNAFDDTRSADQDNAVFAQNVVNWLADPSSTLVPSEVSLPAAAPLPVGALAGLGLLRRRRTAGGAEG